jgi:hypothetical protein
MKDCRARVSLSSLAVTAKFSGILGFCGKHSLLKMRFYKVK